MSSVELGLQRAGIGREASKFRAFIRRDFLVAWSYRLSFFTYWITLFAQIFLFYFVGRLILPSSLPAYGGRHPSYLEFVGVGIALSTFLQVGLTRMVAAIRHEQLIGTLESLLVTPTALVTIQLGSALYDFLYVPLRTLVFFVAVSVLFDVSFHWTGLVPAGAVLLALMPFVLGLGSMAAAGVLTFRGSQGAVGFGATALVIASGTYFPTEVLPGFVQAIVPYNAIAMAIEGTRDAMLGGAGWATISPVLMKLVPISVLSLAAGLVAFRAALWRERRRGTLGLY